MKVILLAAGKGERLRPFTNDIPKCMVNYKNKPLLQHQLEVFDSLNISRNAISVVGGYKHEKINILNLKKFINYNYDTTNMVRTLFCAEEWMNEKEDLLICYTDIIYKKSIIKDIIDSNAQISICADLNWKDLWLQRMENPLNDAETFKTNPKNGNLIELGKKTKYYKDIEAQYMGIIKIRANMISKFKDFYYKLDRNEKYDNKKFEEMYMTSLLQKLIEYEWEIKPIYTNGNWFEVDSVSDLNYLNLNFNFLNL